MRCKFGIRRHISCPYFQAERMRRICREILVKRDSSEKIDAQMFDCIPYLVFYPEFKVPSSINLFELFQAAIPLKIEVLEEKLYGLIRNRLYENRSDDLRDVLLMYEFSQLTDFASGEEIKARCLEWMMNLFTHKSNIFNPMLILLSTFKVLEEPLIEGLCHHLNDDIDEAMKLYAKVTRREDDLFCILLGVIHLKRKDETSALDLIRFMLEKNPRNVFAPWLRCYLHLLKQNHAKALADIDEVMALEDARRDALILTSPPAFFLNSPHIGSLLLRGYVYCQMNHLAQAGVSSEFGL